MTASSSRTPIRGTTVGGVPYVARRSASAGAPVIAAWHLLDPPRSEQAFAAAMPLEGLDATVVYFGLPLSGLRMPDGGMDEIMRRVEVDAVLRVFSPICLDAVDEFPAAFAEAREALGVARDAPVGLLGGSAGSAVAAGVLAGGASRALAAVLVSPMLQLRPHIDAQAAFLPGGSYAWFPDAEGVAARMDFVARASEITATKAAVRVIVGADDMATFREPAGEFAAATGADLRIIDGVGHALAVEPGLEAAAQTEAARVYDALAVEWFREHLA